MGTFAALMSNKRMDQAQRKLLAAEAEKALNDPSAPTGDEPPHGIETKAYFETFRKNHGS